MVLAAVLTLVACGAGVAVHNLQHRPDEVPTAVTAPLDPHPAVAIHTPKAMQPHRAAASRLAQHAARERDRLRPTSFMVSSFNLLGYSHTASHGNKAHHRWPNGHTRMGWAVSLLRRFSVSVAGLQEFQTPQYDTFVHVAGGEYDVYPGRAGGSMGVQNSIVWRRSEWKLVESHTLGVRYFGGSVVQMPYIELENLDTGQRVWFANYHNPADVRGPAGHWRAIDADMEARLFARLLKTGAPVIVTGDMNDRANYFCRVSAILPELHGANGSARVGGSCRVPAHIGIDWIIGTGAVSFDGFTSFSNALVRRTSDHPIVVAKATVTLTPETSTTR